MATNELKKVVDSLLTTEHFDDDMMSRLLSMDPEAMELVAQYATGSHPSGNPEIQERAILTLGASRDRSHIPVLKKALRSPDPDVRVRAMWALGNVGGDEAADAVSEAVQSDELSDAERAHGIRSLAEIEDQRATEALESLEDAIEMDDYVKEELDEALSKKQ